MSLGYVILSQKIAPLPSSFCFISLQILLPYSYKAEGEGLLSVIALKLSGAWTLSGKEQNLRIPGVGPQGRTALALPLLAAGILTQSSSDVELLQLLP